MVKEGYVEEEDETPLSIFLGKIKKMKMVLTPSASVGKDPTMGQTNIEVEGIETLDKF